VERDRPLALRPALAARAPSRLVLPRTPRLVLAFHYPWYGTPDGPARRWRHWNHAQLAMPGERVLGFHDPRRGQLATAHHPAGGPYDSASPRLIRAQMLAARAAGVDGFVVSVWGRESDEARVFGAMLAEAGDGGFRLAPYYEAGELWRRGGSGIAADLEELLARHGGSAGWLRVADTPVVFVYGAHRVRPPVWEYVRRRLAAGGHRVLLIGDATGPAWLPHQDALHVYSPIPGLARGEDPAVAYRARAALAAAAGLPFIPAVAPGFDDRRIRTPGTVVPRADGATYEATWAAALAVDPPWVVIASWNEWHEGSEIEPSRELGTRYLDATRAWAQRFRGGP
jgi:hypothetical protein